MSSLLDHSATETLLFQYYQNRDPSTKEEILSMMSFQKIQIENLGKKFRRRSRLSKIYSGIITILNLGILSQWILAYLVATNTSTDCTASQNVLIQFMVLQLLSGLDIVLLLFGIKQQKKKPFLYLLLFLLAQLVGRIFVYGNYFINLQAIQSCLGNSWIANSTIVKSLCGAICLFDIILFLIVWHLIWLVQKIRSRSKVIGMIERSNIIR